MFDERGGMPQRAGMIAQRFIPRGAAFEFEAHPEAKVIRIKRMETSATNAPMVDRGYRCLDCRDTGAGRFTLLAPFHDQEIAYTYVYRCLCPAGYNLPEWVPTYPQLFNGAMPGIQQAPSVYLPPPQDDPAEPRVRPETKVFDLTALLGEDDD